MVLYGAETWPLQAADEKYLERFEMWYWRIYSQNCNQYIQKATGKVGMNLFPIYLMF
jgi:hypothetical protein